MAVTRAQIRSWVGSLLGEVITLTATSSGSTTSLVDNVNLSREDGYLEGRQLIVVSAANAANVGKVRRVSANSKSAKSITIDPALPAATATGDVVELWFRRDQGPTIPEVNDAISRSVSAVASTVLIPKMASGAAVFDRTNPIVTEVGSTWTFFSGVDWKDPNDIWHPVPPADIRLAPSGNLPYVDVEIRNRTRSVMDGMQYRVKGYATHDIPDEDTDVIAVDSEWLTHQVAAQLLLASSGRMSDQMSAERKAQYLQTLADARRPKPGIRPRGMLVKLFQ